MAYAPKYYFDPKTQRYTLLNPVNPTPEQSAGLAALREQASYGGGGSGTGASGPGSSGPGSGGALGDVGLGMMGYADATMGMAPGAAVAGVVGSALADQAISQQAETDQNLATMNEQAITSQVTMGPFGPVASPVSPVSISPVANPEAQVSALAAMTAQQQAEQDQEAALAANVDSVADAVADAQAATDSAEASEGAAAAAASEGATGDSGGSTGDAGSSADGNAGADGVGQGSTGDSSSDGSSGDGSGDGGSSGGGDGEKAGGLIGAKKYAFGGGVMGMGEASPRYAYAPVMMAGGGLAAAKQVQGQGRGKDTMLVHMTPNEVRGLDAIARAHGGKLTINPKTGLPEAGFLESILPIVAGAALAPFTGGASMAALLVGGGTALMTGSLQKGLMAGLGAFGGAGLGSALGAAGASTAGQVVTPAVAQAASVVPQATASAVPGTFSSAAQELLLAGSPSAGAFTPAAATTVAPSVAPTFAGNLQQMGTGLSNVVQGTPGARDAFMSKVGGTSGLLTNVSSAAAPALGSMVTPEEEAGLPKSQTYIRPYKYEANYQGEEPGFNFRTGETGEPTSELSYFRPQFTPVGVYKPGEEPSRFAEGGDVKGIGSNVRKRINRMEEPYEFADFRKKRAMQEAAKQMFAMGGLTAFAKGGQNLPPRYLKGGGDGMSDSIPANIDGKQEARLADGEFVIPADVVSHLGNGSSNAGAKRLHNMMDRIRQARTGKAKQAPEVKAERFMPA